MRIRTGHTAGTALFAFIVTLAGLSQAHQHESQLPAGSNTVLIAPISGSPGQEAIISDVVFEPNSSLPLHTHPGEEFVYLISGTVFYVEQGKPDRPYSAGEAFVIPAGVVHGARVGDQPGRAIVFRIHVEGEPERTLVK
ncbi:MAG: cupin domain-containing protein [Pseudomonadota bacterium]